MELNSTSASSDPSEHFNATVVIVAPHMDDEALACGGLIARLQGKADLHVVYATDGMKSPAPTFPWNDSITPDLGEVRRQESRNAMAILGIHARNLHFLGLPEARLKDHIDELDRLLTRTVVGLRPDHVLIPFRFDRHPDHLAINRTISSAVLDGRIRAELSEYFVYYRSRLLPRRDVRKYIRPEKLFRVSLESVARKKREALDCFKTQTTRYYPWQTRPILTDALLEEECVGPEQFLCASPRLKDQELFVTGAKWIRVAHWLEPILQRWKHLLKSTLLRGRWENSGATDSR